MKVDAPIHQDSAEVFIQAPPQKVYELVSNITCMGEWSPECYRCEWLGEAKNAAVDARFKGWNRAGLGRWTTSCRMIAAQRLALGDSIVQPYHREGRKLKAYFKIKNRQTEPKK